jgi:hypothetical protein
MSCGQPMAATLCLVAATACTSAASPSELDAAVQDGSGGLASSSSGASGSGPGGSGAGGSASEGGSGGVAGGSSGVMVGSSGGFPSGTGSGSSSGTTSGIAGSGSISSSGAGSNDAGPSYSGSETDGEAGGGSGESEGGVADKSVAQVLDGYAIVKPCSGAGAPANPNPNETTNMPGTCNEDPTYENQHNTLTFGGDPAVTYTVTVRIAGVAERYWYAGGMLDMSAQPSGVSACCLDGKGTPITDDVFYAGGLPTIHSARNENLGLAPGQGACKIHPPETDGQYKLPFAVPPEINPSDGCFNGFNIFALTVSAPKKSYYLNYTEDYDNVDRQPHEVYKTDYTTSIRVNGQAQLDLYTIDGDHHQVYNTGTLTVPNVKTKQPYVGNFLEFTVLSVTSAP